MVRNTRYKYYQPNEKDLKANRNKWLKMPFT